MRKHRKPGTRSTIGMSNLVPDRESLLEINADFYDLALFMPRGFLTYVFTLGYEYCKISEILLPHPSVLSYPLFNFLYLRIGG